MTDKPQDRDPLYALGVSNNRLRGLLARAGGLILKRCLKPIDPYEEAACLIEEIDAALGEAAHGRRPDCGISHDWASMMHSDRLEKDALRAGRQAKAERLLKLAPEMPPLAPDDPLSSETVRAHDRCDDLYRGMRAFDARLANLEEATAALERRLDDLSLIRDKQQGSDD